MSDYLIDFHTAIEAMSRISDSICEAEAVDALCELPTVDAIPIEWILNNERMPKAGTGRKVIMDMLEDWRKEHDTAD